MPEDGLGGLATPLQRTGDDPTQRDGRETVSGALGLPVAGVVEGDAGCSSRQDAFGVRGAASVTDQDDCGHVAEVSRDGASRAVVRVLSR